MEEMDSVRSYATFDLFCFVEQEEASHAAKVPEFFSEPLRREGEELDARKVTEETAFVWFLQIAGEVQRLDPTKKKNHYTGVRSSKKA